MSWIGVPFATDADFVGFSWTAPDFINQFIAAAEMRVNALRELSGDAALSFSRIEEGAVLGTATQLNNLRNLGNYWYAAASGGSRNAEYATAGATPLYPSLAGMWVNPSGVAIGETWDTDTLDFFQTGLAQASLMQRMNEILTAAGCPEISETPTASTAAMGIPWTRQWGDPDAPTVGTGAVGVGDIVGRHVFNEWWAFLEALTCLRIGTLANAWHNGSEISVRSITWNESGTPITDHCGHLASLANAVSDATTTIAVRPGSHELYAIRFLPDGLSDNGSGASSATEATSIISTPNLTHGDTVYLFARRDTTNPTASGYDSIYQDFVTGGAAAGEIFALASRADDGADLTLVVGTLDNLMAEVSASCVNPSSGDVAEILGQTIETSLVAVKFAFPAP